MDQLITINEVNDIPSPYRHNAIGRLLEYHNLDRPLDEYSCAQLLIGMCMDNRSDLRIPQDFAYILRQGGANLRNSEFYVSYALAMGSVSFMALIGHNDCAMRSLESKKDSFVQGLMKQAGWEKNDAEEHFTKAFKSVEIGSESDFILNEVKRLRLRYPKVTIAPMLYKVEDRRLYLLKE